MKKQTNKQKQTIVHCKGRQSLKNRLDSVNLTVKACLLCFLDFWAKMRNLQPVLSLSFRKRRAEPGRGAEEGRKKEPGWEQGLCSGVSTAAAAQLWTPPWWLFEWVNFLCLVWYLNMFEWFVATDWQLKTMWKMIAYLIVDPSLARFVTQFLLIQHLNRQICVYSLKQPHTEKMWNVEHCFQMKSLIFLHVLHYSYVFDLGSAGTRNCRYIIHMIELNWMYPHLNLRLLA